MFYYFISNNVEINIDNVKTELSMTLSLILNCLNTKLKANLLKSDIQLLVYSDQFLVKFDMEKGAKTFADCTRPK